MSNSVRHSGAEGVADQADGSHAEYGETDPRANPQMSLIGSPSREFVLASAATQTLFSYGALGDAIFSARAIDADCLRCCEESQKGTFYVSE